jgi:uncharacterized protein (TIGR01777 family)
MKRIILAGGSGFLGTVLAAHFQKSGYEITVLTRLPRATMGEVRQIEWDACSPGGWERELDGAYAVINLVGRSVNSRYHARNRRLILETRVKSTQFNGEAIAKCKMPPPVWLNAGTATIYKHTFGKPWDESGETGATPEAKDEFSIEVATAWEQALSEAPTPGTRKVALRAAMVLGTGENSVFPVLRRLTRWGLGGKMGDGRQYVSWIHEADFCRALEWVLTHENFTGPVNICAPNPIPNSEMMNTFRKTFKVLIGLPAAEWILEIGAFVLRTETELLIKSRRVFPQKLVNSGFTFYFPFLRQALEALKAKGRLV